MSLELAICLITLFGMAGIGTPIGYSIMMASIMYFAIGGFDIALTGEKILQGLYNSFVLLAVPLFISAASIKAYKAAIAAASVGVVTPP